MRQNPHRMRSDRAGPRGRGFLRGLSLKHKLITVIMLTCISTLVPVSVILGAWEWTTLCHTMVHDLSAHAEILADTCQRAVLLRDRVGAHRALRTMGTVDSVMAACIYTSEGELFAVYQRRGHTGPLPHPSQPPRDYVLGWNSLVLAMPIVCAGRPLGVVCVKTNLHALYARLEHGLVVILCTMALSALAAYLISSRLQRIISGPIVGLADVARRVSERREYTARAAPGGGDEVGMLIQAFNGMLGQIEHRDRALVEANEQLEARVRERTAALLAANEKLTRAIAARRQTDRALAEANEHLAETVKSLRRSNKELQDFAYVTAHDLRAPVRGIGILADWITSDYADKLDEQGRRQLDLLKGRVTRLTELINGLLHYAEIGRRAGREEVVDLEELVAETLARLAPPVHVRVVVHRPLPVVVGDRARLGQVFHHLLDNAIKYLDKPRGRIEVRATDRGRHWEVAVSDNGPGIDPKYFVKIFQMFQTLAPRDQRESTGIGLPIAKKIVELFGGSLWVESGPGAGATFFFTLPRQAARIPEQALTVQSANLS